MSTIFKKKNQLPPPPPELSYNADIEEDMDNLSEDKLAEATRIQEKKMEKKARKRKAEAEGLPPSTYAFVHAAASAAAASDGKGGGGGGGGGGEQEKKKVKKERAPKKMLPLQQEFNAVYDAIVSSVDHSVKYVVAHLSPDARVTTAVTGSGDDVEEKEKKKKEEEKKAEEEKNTLSSLSVEAFAKQMIQYGAVCDFWRHETTMAEVLVIPFAQRDKFLNQVRAQVRSAWKQAGATDAWVTMVWNRGGVPRQITLYVYK